MEKAFIMEKAFTFLHLFIFSLAFFETDASNNLPADMQNGMKNAKTLDEFLYWARTSNDGTQTSADANLRARGVPERCDLEEICVLVPICEPIEANVNHPDRMYYPRSVKLTRCVNSSHHKKKICKPILSDVNKRVIEFIYYEDATGSRSFRNFTKTNHTSCYHEDITD